MDLMQKIGRTGPSNAAILDTENGLISKGSARILVVDQQLVSKLKFIKEGQFSEKDGAPTLKLVGDVSPVDQVDVVKHVRENLTKAYPLSAIQLAERVAAKVPGASRNDVWRCINDNAMKGNSDYSAYNFRNKQQEDTFKATGDIPTTTPVIYNQAAVEFISNVLKNAARDA